MSPEARERSFDELARGLASGSISRRRALRLMGGVLVGGTLASLGFGGVAGADEECKPTGRKCRKNQQCCSNNCSKSGTSSFGTCAAGCLSDNSPCTASSQCCGFCNEGFCEGRNFVECHCGASLHVACRSIDCSDTTALNQFCTARCADAGASLTGTSCTPDGCL